MTFAKRSLVGTACASIVMWACGSPPQEESGSDEEDLTVAECQTNARLANESCVKLANQNADVSRRKQATAGCAKTLAEAMAKCASLAPPADSGTTTALPRGDSGIVTNPKPPDGGPKPPEAGPPPPDGGPKPPEAGPPLPDGGPKPPEAGPPPPDGGPKPPEAGPVLPQAPMPHP